MEGALGVSFGEYFWYLICLGNLTAQPGVGCTCYLRQPYKVVLTYSAGCIAFFRGA